MNKKLSWCITYNKIFTYNKVYLSKDIFIFTSNKEVKKIYV